MIIRAEELKDVCSKILSAVDNTDSTVITETLELKADGNVFEVAVTNREYFVEMMAHIMTIEDILMARYNISSEEINKAKNTNRREIKKQLEGK